MLRSGIAGSASAAFRSRQPATEAMLRCGVVQPLAALRGKTLKPEGARGPIVAPRVQRSAPVVRTAKPRIGNPRTDKRGPAKGPGPVRGEGRRRARTTGGR